MNIAVKGSKENQLTPIYRAKGEGKDYAWGKDHIFVKLSKAETGGALTLIQDNLKKGFNLGLHLHHKHTEIFYILSGEVDFLVAGQRFKVTKGSVLYIPEGTPHAAKSSTGAQMLMFYTPGGFDEMLSAIDNASLFQRFNPFASAARNRKYDMNKIKGEDALSNNGVGVRYIEAGEGRTLEDEVGSGLLKLSSTETKGLATVFEQKLEAGDEREVLQEKNGQSEIMYILEGEIEYVVNNISQIAGSESTVYLPAGVSANVKTSKGARVLVFRMLGDSESKN